MSIDCTAKRDPFRGASFSLLSGFCYGLIGYFGINIIKLGLTVPFMLFFRFLISTLFTACMILIYRKKLTVHDSFSNIKKMFFTGGILYSASAITYFFASTYIGTGPSMVILFSYPVIVILLNWIFYQSKISLKFYFSIFLILIGLMFLAPLDEFKMNGIGIFLAFLSAIFYALYIVMSKEVKLSPMTSTFMVSLSSTLFCLIVALFTGTGYHNLTIGLENAFLWFNILGIGIIGTALPILFLLYGLKYISSTEASILSVSEPVFVVLFGIILLNEQINSMKMLGIFIILFGAFISIIDKRIFQALRYT